MTRVVIAGLASTTAFAACGSESARPGGGELRVALVGQSLSRYDPRDFLEAPASTVARHLRSANVAFTNLEVSIDGVYCPCPPTKEGNSLQVARPSVVEFLSELNFGLLSLSNNHSWNLSGPGVRSTIEATRANGVTHAGTGATLAEAVAAGVREVGEHRVGLIASATVKLGAAAAAGDARPGVNLLRIGNDEDRARNLASIGAASDTTDILIVYQHFQVEDEDVAPGNEFGHGSVSDLDAWQRQWARSVIDEGASVYVAHGAREFKGVEVYRDGLIFYGLGNFIFHSGQPIGYYAPDVWESVLATVTFRANEPTAVDFVPIVLDEGSPGVNFLERRGVPEVAQGTRASTILDRLIEFSADLGTDITRAGDRATLVLDQGG